MKKFIGELILKLFGWKLNVPQKFRIEKGVMVGAPHTSNWDALFSLAGMWASGFRPKFFIKKEWIEKPLIGTFFKWLGGIPVDRQKRNNLVEYSVQLLKNTDKLMLLVPAEGTRSRVEKWKKGFYYIALQAGVPVVLAYLDYKKKEAGVGDVFKLSGNFKEDMLRIENFFKNIHAKYPEKYNPRIFIREEEN